MDDIRLYHGSKGGIKGKIKPSSREKCDFGCGFYMGTELWQAETLVFDDENPILYDVNLKLSKIPESRILILDDIPWAFFVLYNRQRLEKIKNTDLYEQLSILSKDKDIIIGPIADDEMNASMKDFIRNQITDETFLECIHAIDYGIQYTAVTENGCNKIEICRQREIYGSEYEKCREIKQEIRKNSAEKVEEIRSEFKREGHSLNEILRDASLQKSIIDELQQISEKTKKDRLKERNSDLNRRFQHILTWDTDEREGRNTPVD